jgi:hypothetical protein
LLKEVFRINKDYCQLDINGNEISMVKIAELERISELDEAFDRETICPECGYKVIDRHDMYKNKQGVFGHLECLGVDDELGVECDVCGRFLLNENVRAIEYYNTPYDEKFHMLYICPENMPPLDKPESYNGYCYEILFKDDIFYNYYFTCEKCKRIIRAVNKNMPQWNYPDKNNRNILYCLKCYDKIKGENNHESKN